MPPTCHLHVGTYKSGTTFLQQRLIDGRSVLRAAGILVPGQRGIGEHVRAGKAVMGWNDLQGRPIPDAAWHRLRDEMLAHQGPSAVFSYEELCAASGQQARRMVDDLRPAEVVVVITARDLVRVLPAAWQEGVQVGLSWTWDEFAGSVMSPDRDRQPGRTFWRNHDLPALAERWAAAVGPEQVIIVTVPPAGSPAELLWARFARAAGIDPSLRIDASPVRNESLDPVATELLRRFNLRQTGAIPRHVYDREVKWFVAKEVLAARSGDDRVRLDDRQTAWAQTVGRDTADRLRALGVRVEGDLADLIGARPADPTAEPVDADDLVEAALDVITALVSRLGERPPRPAEAHLRSAAGQRRGRLVREDRRGPQRER